MKKTLTKNELFKKLKEWISKHNDDTRYNLSIGSRFNASIEEIVLTESQFEKIMKRFDKVDERIDAVDAKVDAVNERLTKIVKLNNLKE